MTGGIMIAAAAYLWKRWRKKEGAEAAVTLFALVALYPILAGGSMEKIWLGYLATLLLSAPIPSRMFVNYAHQMPAGQRHERTTFPKASRCALYYSRTAFPRASRCVFYYSRTAFPRASRCVFYYSRTAFPRASRCVFYYSRTAFPKASKCVFYYSRTAFPRASRCVFYYSRTAFPRASRCVFYYSRTIFPRASRCVFYYSRFAAGGFLAASLVMEPSCSALMAASPPGPADARIGLIGTASQQPA